MDAASQRVNAEPSLARFFHLLENHYGPTGWWPGETPFEIAVGAILVQNTAWTNVERAIQRLEAADLLCPRSLLTTPVDQVEAAVRPSGFFRIKTKRLLAFCAYLVNRYDGDMEKLREVDTPRLREELLGINGIGPETADDILLYACAKPVFVVDAYTRRILLRHGLVASSISYSGLQQYCQDRLPSDLRVYQEMHALLVLTAKDYCRKTPRCAGCPLQCTLSHGQPLA